MGSKLIYVTDEYVSPLHTLHVYCVYVYTIYVHTVHAYCVYVQMLSQTAVTELLYTWPPWCCMGLNSHMQYDGQNLSNYPTEENTILLLTVNG